MLKNGQKLVEEVQKCKRLKFDSISLTGEGPVNKENSILEKSSKSNVYGLNETLSKV
jgi:hypothetical protein